MSKNDDTQTKPARMKRVNHFMPQVLVDGLDEAARKLGGSAAEHNRKAVTSYLKRHKLLKE